MIINDDLTSAVGEITYLSGQVLDIRGNPIRNVLVEIWQVDANGAYLHSGSGNRDKRDANFQGFGRFLTGSKEITAFARSSLSRTPGTPHIHVAVKVKGRRSSSRSAISRVIPT